MEAAVTTRPRGARIGIVGLCLLFAIHGLAGCAEMSQGQTGAAVGAGAGVATGALVGALAGGKKGAVIGAVAGGVLGGLVGWQVGEYRTRKVREGSEVSAATGYRAEQGVIAKIEASTNAPQQLRPGDKILLQTNYTLLSPPAQGQVKVKETRTVFFNGQELGRLEKESSLTSGTYATEQTLSVPPDAAEGRYLVQTVVQPVSAGRVTVGQANSDFMVGSGTPIGSGVTGTTATPTRSTPPSGVKSPLPSTTIPSAVYVKLSTANVREGAGTTFKVIATASKGARLAVIGDGGSERDRWYLVRLADGREGWVALSAVSADPQ